MATKSYAPTARSPSTSSGTRFVAPTSSYFLPDFPFGGHFGACPTPTSGVEPLCFTARSWPPALSSRSTLSILGTPPDSLGPAPEKSAFRARARALLPWRNPLSCIFYRGGSPFLRQRRPRDCCTAFRFALEENSEKRLLLLEFSFLLLFSLLVC